MALVPTFFGVVFLAAHAGDPAIAQARWGGIAAVSLLVAGLLAPVVGAWSDRRGRWFGPVAAATTLCIAATLAMPGVAGQALALAALFFVAQVSQTLAGAVYDSLLVRVTSSRHVGRVSGFGWACGFVGGIASLAAALVLMRGTPEDAQAALLPLKQGLKRALETALAEGPIAAVDACRIEAPRIAAESAQPGVRIGRTSHRLRNPANAPAVWMQPLLAEFEKAGRAEGKGRLVDLGSEGVGYVEPIHLQPLCVTCHGTHVAPELLAHIRKLYPEDRAVGFEPGDFRGLFWVVLEARKAEQ